MIRKLLIHSEQEMKNLAEELFNRYSKGAIITLNGNLGAGKTFLVKAFCHAAGVPLSSSPTFAIVNSYDGKIKIYHFDFYRIKKSDELHDIGIEEYLLDESAVSFIEWANLFPEVLPKKRVDIMINVLNDEIREVIIESHE
ncbi:tRNA (adenosine(37)-N6)-threonylcarbamoyltransferase complex ATPase subunit type 1 TsaE [Ignavibacteriales bacterium]